MVTLKDIARTAELSVTQVSRALNDHSDVNEETRRRVKDIARALNYEPNISARKLVSGRSGIVALVVSSYPGVSSDLMFFEMVAGLSAQFSGRGMQFVLHLAPENEDIIAVYQRLVGNGALDGFVITEPAMNDPRVEYLTRRDVPFVLHGRLPGQPHYPFYDIDNEAVGRDQTSRLISLGHRRIAYINGMAHRTYAAARDAGYRALLAEAGIPYDPALVRFGIMTEAFGLVSAIEMMRAPGERPTAFICANVLIASGVYRALQALGLSIPGDVSVVAHDDMLPNVQASAFTPPLAVTYSPLADSWEPLAEYLSGIIEGRPLEELQVLVRHSFISRGSMGPASIQSSSQDSGQSGRQ